MVLILPFRVNNHIKISHYTFSRNKLGTQVYLGLIIYSWSHYRYADILTECKGWNTAFDISTLSFLSVHLRVYCQLAPRHSKRWWVTVDRVSDAEHEKMVFKVHISVYAPSLLSLTAPVQCSLLLRPSSITTTYLVHQSQRLMSPNSSVPHKSTDKCILNSSCLSFFLGSSSAYLVSRLITIQFFYLERKPLKWIST